MKHMLIMLCGLLIAGCASNGTLQATPWAEIEAHPAALEGVEITVCGWFVAEFEGCQVSALKPANPGEAGQLWVGPKSTICDLESVMKNPKRGWANISGEFHYSIDYPNKGYGHFGTYRAVISKADVKMRSTPCK